MVRRSRRRPGNFCRSVNRPSRPRNQYFPRYHPSDGPDRRYHDRPREEILTSATNEPNHDHGTMSSFRNNAKPIEHGASFTTYPAAHGQHPSLLTSSRAVFQYAASSSAVGSPAEGHRHQALGRAALRQNVLVHAAR